MAQSPDLRLAISPERLADAATSYARSGILRIADLFVAKAAEALYRHLDTEIEWSRTVSEGEEAWDLTPGLVAAIDPGKQAEITAAAHRVARDGFQFIFDSVIVSDDPAVRRARGLLVDRVLDALNQPASLDMFRTITGARDLRLINGQATRYLSGHFLTSHDDNIDGEDRIAAYVINLTRGWRPDWGGMLQFHSPAGDIPLALKPGFNTIHMFRVPQVHSVSYVTPFAAVPRYAITGWLRR